MKNIEKQLLDMVSEEMVQQLENEGFYDSKKEALNDADNAVNLACKELGEVNVYLHAMRANLATGDELAQLALTCRKRVIRSMVELLDLACIMDHINLVEQQEMEMEQQQSLDVKASRWAPIIKALMEVDRSGN